MPSWLPWGVRCAIIASNSVWVGGISESHVCWKTGDWSIHVEGFVVLWLKISQASGGS